MALSVSPCELARTTYDRVGGRRWLRALRLAFRASFPGAAEPMHDHPCIVFWLWNPKKNDDDLSKTMHACMISQKEIDNEVDRSCMQ
jgi:hypothetical protein